MRSVRQWPIGINAKHHKQSSAQIGRIKSKQTNETQHEPLNSGTLRLLLLPLLTFVDDATTLAIGANSDAGSFRAALCAKIAIKYVELSIMTIGLW